MKKIIILLIAVILGMADTCYAQGQITRPGKPSKPKPIVNTANYSKPSHLALVLRDSQGNRKYVTETQWSSFPNKSKYEKVGICMIKDGERFILAWEDEYDNVGYTNYNTAYKIYGNLLPTKAQATVIENCTRLREVARSYGADNYGNWYWTRTQCPAPDDDCCYIFCPGIPHRDYDRCPKDEPANTGVVLVYPL